MAAIDQRQNEAWSQLAQLVKLPDTADKANRIFSLMANNPFTLNEAPNIPVGQDGAKVNRTEYLALQAARLVHLRSREGHYTDWKNCLSSTSSSSTRKVVVTIARQALKFAKDGNIPDTDIPISSINVAENYTADEQKAGKRGKKMVSKPIMGSAKVEIADAAMIYTEGNPHGAGIKQEALDFIASKGGDRAKAITGFWAGTVSAPGASTGSPRR